MADAISPRRHHYMFQVTDKRAWDERQRHWHWLMDVLTWVVVEQHQADVSVQLFRLECVKFIFDVSSSQRCWRAALSDSMRWSAMSGPPDSSYCFSKSWHSSSKHGVYVGRKPRGMEWRAACCIAPQKRCQIYLSKRYVFASFFLSPRRFHSLLGLHSSFCRLTTPPPPTTPTLQVISWGRAELFCSSRSRF